jgi:PAS domain S-box-containing protein
MPPNHRNITSVNETRLAARISLALVFIISFLNLAGWLLDIPFLRSISGEWVPMQIIAAGCFLLAGSAITLILGVPSRKQKLLSGFLAITVIVVALITIGEYIYIMLTGSEISFTKMPRMAFLTAVLFLFTGCIIFILGINRERLNNIAHVLIFPVAISGYFVVITYILNEQYLHELINMYVALNTGIVFCALSIVIILVRPGTWLMKIFSSKRTGGIMARRLLPALIVLPVIIGLLRNYSEHSQVFKSDAGIVYITLAYTVCFILLLWVTARTVNRIDEKRYEARTNELLELNMALSNEISERIKAERVAEAERKRFTDVVEILPAYIILLTPDYRVSYANKFFRERFGDASGKRCYEYLFNRTEPCEVCETYKVFKENKPLTWEWTGPDNRNYSIFDFPFTDTDGSAMILEMGIDVTDLKKAEYDLKKFNSELEQMVTDRTRDLSQLNRTLNSLGKSSQAMMHSSDEQHYLEEVCRIIVEDCGHKMVWIGYAQDDPGKTVTPVAYTGFEEGYLETLDITWADTERGRGPTGSAVRTGKVTMCRNIHTDPAFEPWRKEAVLRGYGSSIVLPLTNEGKAFGALNIYSEEPDPFSEGEISLLAEIADDLAYGIIHIRLTESEKKAIELIRESEEKYRMLFDSMTEGFALHEILTDESGKPVDYTFLSINPAFEKLTGLKAKKLIGKKVTEVLPGTEQRWIDTYGKVALTGESTEFENFHSGLNKHFKVSAFSPKRGYFAVIFENITDRILAEKELSQTKNYLENLINNANAPIIVWDRMKRIRLFNHAFEHLTGYLASEVSGEKLDILFPKETLKESNEKIQLAISQDLRTVEIPILTKKQEQRIILWNSANIYDENKKIISTIAQGNDITERIMAEEQMRLSGEKLELALANGNIGTWEWDMESGKLEWDKRMELIFGLNPGSFEGTYDAFEKILAEEDIPHVRKALREALDNNSPFDTVFRIKMNGDSMNYISAKASVIRNNAGKPVKMSGVCVDITDMKNGAEKAMFKLNEDLLRSNRELEQFAYIASHDLQEPLRMVSSFTQLLSHRYHDKLDADAHDFIRFSVDGAARMQALINDLLEFSRIETRGREFKTIDLNESLARAIDTLRINIEKKHAIITYNRMPSLLADEGQIVQLFQNLIGNAIKFCTVTPRIYYIFS